MSQPRSSSATVAVLCLVQLVDVLGVTVLLTALPTVLDDLDAGPTAGTVLITGYAVFFGGLLMAASRLGDRVGHRRSLVAGVVLFGVASVLGALATTAAVLVAARCLQGVSAAVSVPSALRLLTTVTEPGRSRERALAAWSAAGAVAGASGFVLGGTVTDALSWRALFWGSAVLAPVVVASLLVLVPRSPPDPSVRVGLPGAALLVGAVGASVAGASLLPEPGRRGLAGVLLAAGVALAGVLVAHERRARHPMLPRGTLALPRLRWGLAGSFLGTATTGSAAVATVHLQDDLGRSASEAGLLLLPFSLAVVVGAAVAPALLGRLPPTRVLAVGLLLVGLGSVGLALLPAVTTVPVAMASAGFGIGLSSVSSTLLGTDVEERLRGTAAGALNTAAQLGTALGTAALLVVAAGLGDVPAWVAAAVVALGGAARAARARPRPDT